MHYQLGCDRIELRTGDNWWELDGFYQKDTTWTCNYKATYERTYDGHILKIWYHANHWIVGLSDTYCTNVGLIKAESSASTPDRVTSVWEEFDEDYNQWVKLYGMTVTCDESRYNHGSVHSSLTMMWGGGVL